MPGEVRDVLGLVRNAVKEAGDAGRVVAFFFLRFAAARLPRSLVLALAAAAGWIFYVTPIGARLRRSVRAAFPASDAGAVALEWLRRPFLDFVIAARIVAGREHPADWPIEQVNRPALADFDQSVIIATSHMSRQAMSSLYVPRIIPKKLMTVIAAAERAPRTPRAVRIRQQLTALMAGIRRLRNGDVEIAEVGDSAGVTMTLLRHLKRANSALIIATDGPWPKHKSDGYERPFAGHAAHNVALGAAWLARISQRPIVACVPFLDERGQVVIEWGEPIPPPAKDDTAADARVMSELLDVFERAVGRCPGQYVLSIGSERRWSETAQCWIGGAVQPAGAQGRRRVSEPVGSKLEA